MGEKTEKVTGGCMCGAVRYQAIGDLFLVAHCHCSSCRRHTGAPVVTLVCFKKDQVRFTTGERRIYESSPGVGRAFCGQCGTPLTWEGEWGDLGPLIQFHISTFDDPHSFVPEYHVHHDARIAWFDVADALPRYHGIDDEDSEPYRRGPAIEGPSA